MDLENRTYREGCTLLDRYNTKDSQYKITIECRYVMVVDAFQFMLDITPSRYSETSKQTIRAQIVRREVVALRSIDAKMISNRLFDNMFGSFNHENLINDGMSTETHEEIHRHMKEVLSEYIKDMYNRWNKYEV